MTQSRSAPADGDSGESSVTWLACQLGDGNNRQHWLSNGQMKVEEPLRSPHSAQEIGMRASCR
jgi:hypothetical protein